MIDHAAPSASADFPWASLAPHLSIVVLRCAAKNPMLGFQAVRGQLLKNPATRGGRKHSKIVTQDEISLPSNRVIGDAGALGAIGADQLFGCVREIEAVPGWADNAAGYVNTIYELNLAIRRRNLIAVRIGESNADRFQRWLDKAPVPPIERIAPRILQYTFLMGEAKGLWLQRAGGRSTRRPDSKTSSGADLRDTLDPFDDSAYSLGSARCEMPEDPKLTMLKGAMGTTLRASQLWLKPMHNLSEFLWAVAEVFDLIEAAPDDEDEITEAFPQLAPEVFDLSEVFGAYDAVSVDVSQLPPSLANNEETQEAAIVLQEAALNVVPGSTAASFKMNVGLDRSEGGTLSVTPKPITHGYMLDFGFLGEPTRESIVQPVLEALRATDLLTVYYESGHVYSDGRISKPNTMISPFGNWRFCDFRDFDITMEKPFNLRSSKEIHAKIGADCDGSLFAWVLKHFGDGWLICDDGSGETADFLQISSEGMLRIIHVKGAESRVPGRQVSARAYEVVTSQASKNLVFMHKERLAERLAATANGRASWYDGKRVDGRDEFIEMLYSWTERQGREIIIVQPHVSKPVYDAVHAEDERKQPVSQNLLRLHRLETLLNSARSSIVKSGADLWVVASKYA